MVQGLDRREVVQDANQPQPLQASNVPLAPVQSPRPSSVKNVGANEVRLAEALGGFEAGLLNYVEKKKPEWELEGMMAYAEAATEQDIVAKGNRYITAGYMTMKARTANLEWLGQQQVDLENNDEIKAMDSATYQKYLMDSFRPMQQNIAGGDPFTNELLFSMSADNFPRLVQQQIVKNNEHRKKELKQSYVDLVNAAGTRLASPDADDSAMEEFESYLQPGVSGLEREDEIEVQSSAIQNLIKLGNERVINYVGQKTQAPRSKDNYSQTIRDTIRQYEAGDMGYDAVVGGDRGITPTNMTIGEIKKWQKDQIAAGATSTAIGGYQFINKTLIETAETLGFGDDVVFSPEIQDRMADEIIRRYGKLDQYLADGKADEFLKRLANQWAALPKDSSGLSAYDGVNGNKALVSYDDIIMTLKEAPKEINAADNLLALGLPLDEVVAIKGVMSQAATERTQQFTDTRLDAEQSIQEIARTTGNEAAVRKAVMQYKDALGLTDTWASSVYNGTEPLIKEYRKEQQEMNEIRYAVSNNTVRHLSSEKQQKAFDFILATATANLQESNIDPATQEEELKAHMVDASIRLGVLDRYTDGWIKTALSGDLVDKDGQVRKDTLQAYQAWLRMYHQDKKLAQEYAGEQQGLLYEAMQNDSYKDGSPQAITKAAQFIKMMDAGYEPPALDDAKFDKTLDKALEDRRVGIWDRLVPGASKKNASDRGWWTFNRQPTKAQERMIKNDTILRQSITRRAQNLLKYKEARTSEAALAMATDQVQAESVIIGGNIITPPLNPRQPSFMQAAGLEGTDLKVNSIHEAFINYMNSPSDDDPSISRGKAEFGDAWNNIEVWDWGVFNPDYDPKNGALPGISKQLGKSIGEWSNGMPEGIMVDYNYDTQMVRVSIPEKIGSNKMHPNVVYLPASVIGWQVRQQGKELILKEND